MLRCVMRERDETRRRRRRRCGARCWRTGARGAARSARSAAGECRATGGGGGLRAGCGRGAGAARRRGTSPRAAGRAPRACVAHAIRASRFDANSAIESAEAAMRRRADARHWTAQARRTRGRVPFPRRARPHGPPIQRVSTSSPSRPPPVGRSRRVVSGPIPALPAGVASLDGALRPRVSRAAARRAGAHTSTAAPSHAASRPLVCNCDRKFATSAARSWYVVASV
ncbi:Uncharacterised protein [Burkholderia pseudomallei]|nr:Uncharacterised protein [Burkholderia pseudomallei]CAJ2799392.1 Uncharacterised protein [Burkholderia pseudomallei]CAJ4197900.1 Uncharacterised protein [Burkholderia pseudomallei]CAJ7392160.1 Uncharacterised protein [Burkholderia pseudomallei]CAJ8068145.1 Uncharacterised protein [Burkholderia pseudomallei]